MASPISSTGVNPAVPGVRMDMPSMCLKARQEVEPTRLAAIGYCFGGTTSLELGRAGCDLKAIVGFHSGLATARPQDAVNIKGKVLVCIGADDPIIPPEQRAQFEPEMQTMIEAGGLRLAAPASTWRRRPYLPKNVVDMLSQASRTILPSMPDMVKFINDVGASPIMPIPTVGHGTR